MKCECCDCEYFRDKDILKQCMSCGVLYKGVYPLPPDRIYMKDNDNQMEGLRDLRTYLKENCKMDKGLEIGTWLGASANIFAPIFKTFYCVDGWWGDPTTPEVYHGCTFNLRFNDNINFIEKISEDAATKFEDDSLDFVYIDGDHRPEFVKQDIELWLPKLKKGGIIAGHDYGRGVEENFDFRGLTKVVDDKFENITVFKDSSWLAFK